MKLENANVDYTKGQYTYIVSYMTDHDRKDHYEIFPSDECDYDDAVEKYRSLISDENIYTASISIEIATTECR